MRDQLAVTVGLRFVVSMAMLLVLSFGASSVFAHLTSTPQALTSTLKLDQGTFRCSAGICETDQIHRPLFNFLAVKWPVGETVFVRVKDQGVWGEWVQAVGEPDSKEEHDDNNVQFFSAVQGTGFQLRKKEGAGTPEVAILFVPKARKSFFKSAVNETTEDLVVLARSQWLDGGIELPAERREQLWPADHDMPKKIIVHHTATDVRDITNDDLIDSADYRELVRAIYVYHAQSRRWGDIGYQYIIDPFGTIYEGRAGGDGVIGGHAVREKACTKFGSAKTNFNNGTIGIAVLGTYSTQSLQAQAKEALSSLIAKKAWDFGFEPAGAQFFQDNIYPNVMGHRDVDCTDCPGDQIFSLLPEITAVAQQKFQAYSEAHTKLYRAQLLPESMPEKMLIKKGETKELSLQYLNTGTATWRRYGDDQIVLAEAGIKSHLASLELFRLAAVGSSTPTSTPNYVRARLKTANVPPGQIGTFTYKVSDIPNELISRRSFVLALGNRGWLGTSEAGFELENTGLAWAGSLVENVPHTIPLKEARQITLQYVNRGTQEWKQGDVLLSIKSQDGKASLLKDASWKKEDGSFAFKEKTVPPGGRATFVFMVRPGKLGVFEQELSLASGKNSISGSNYEKLFGEVKHARAAELVYLATPSEALNSEKTNASIALRNIGIEPWEKPSLLSFGKNQKSRSVFRDASWKSGNLAAQGETTLPGELANIDFVLKSPKGAGSYGERLVLKDGAKEIPIIGKKGIEKGVEFSVKVIQKKVPAKKKTSKK